MDFKAKKIKDVIVISLSGNFLLDNEKSSIDNYMLTAIQGNRINKFVLDFTSVGYINSSGLNLMMRILTTSRNHGGETVLANIPKKIKDLLIMTKLSSVFKIHNSIKEACEELKSMEDVNNQTVK